MNKKIVILSALASSAFLSAQSIEGTITNTSHQPSTDTEILVTKANSKFSAITDEKGKYKITLKEDGNYILQIIKDGITTNTENITVKGDLLKNIEIKEKKAPTEQKIEGVTMTVKKKLFERKVDRLVFNVENSIASQGIDALEALAKTPMVRTTDDAVSIAGRSNVAIMVNDRLLNLSGQEMINYLKTLRSDDIAKIEVITTPPAKYEAEGKSGLINIVLKKNTSLGWNGSLQTSGRYYWNRPVVSTRSGASFNYQGKKLSVTTNLSLGDNYWEERAYNHLTGKGNTDYWNTESKGLNNYRYKGGNVKGEYKINDKNLVGINYNYSYSNPIEKAQSYTRRQSDNTPQEFYSDSDNRNIRKVHNATVFYDVKLDTVGSKLSLSANVMLNDANAKNLYNTVTNVTTASFVNPISQYKIYSGQADLEKNFAKIKTEAGMKFTGIKNNSYFNFFDIVNSQNIRNTVRSNDFFYNEQNYAAYASTSFKINEKWDAKAGLRYEYTNLEGVSVNDNVTNNIRYGKFFPTAYLGYKANDNNTFSVNYSRRISRPYFGNLNPFKNIISEFEYSTGNPYLLPSFSDNLELGYVLKNNFNVTAYYNYNKDNSDRIQVVEGSQKYSIVKNFYNEDQAGINISYNYNKLKWLESNIFVNGFYAKSKSYDVDAIAAPAGYGANFNLDNNFFLNKEKTVTLTLGFWSEIPNRSGNTYFNGNFSAYSGVKMNLMQKNLIINFSVNDLFNSNRTKGTEYYPNYDVEYYGKGINRNLNLSVTYKFGNKNVKGATKQVQFEESSRAGS